MCSRRLQLIHATPSEPQRVSVDRTNTATDDPAPSLHPHYRSFPTTTSRSASRTRNGTHTHAAHGLVPLARSQTRTGSVASGLLPFHAEAADRARVASMPDTTWPSAGTRQARPGIRKTPRFRCHRFFFDTSTANRLRSPSRSPPDASSRLFHIAHHGRVTVPAACGGLKPPPAGRLRRADNPSSPAQHRISKLSLHRAPFHVRDAPYGRTPWPPPRFGATAPRCRARRRAGPPRATGTAAGR